VSPDKISVHLSGGLGNQMFQYMAGYALSKQASKQLIVNQNWFYNPWLLHKNNPAYLSKRKMDSLQFLTISDAQRDRFPTPRDGRFERGVARLTEVKRRSLGIASEQSFIAGEWADARGIRRLVGFFMSPKYFLGLDPTDVFRNLAVPLSSWSTQFLGALISQRSIGVHIRLGDYVFLGDKVIPQEEYFLSGIDLLKANMGSNSKVYLFTDDPIKLKQLFPKLIEIGEIISSPLHTTSVENLLLLSKCGGFVCSNSTFSWWAATLSNAPAEWIVRPSYFFTEMPDIDTQADLWQPHSYKIHPILGEQVE
jgi:hypothetical protein